MLRCAPLPSGLSLCLQRITISLAIRSIRAAIALSLIATMPTTSLAVGSVCTSTSPATSQFVYVGQTTGHFGENLVLAAMLTDSAGVPVANRTVAFAAGSQVLNAITNQNGVAQVSFSALQVGTLNVTAKFSGDAAYAPAVLTTSLTITPELTVLSYSGSLLLQNAVMQTVSATLTDSLQRPLSNQQITFSVGGVQTLATTNAQGIASASITLPASVAGALQLVVTFAGNTNYMPAQQTLPADVFPATRYVIWGGNTGGLQIGQTVNFVGRQWFRQVHHGHYEAGDDFTGFAAKLNKFGLCSGRRDNERRHDDDFRQDVDDFCWQSHANHGCSSSSLPPFIGLMVSNSIVREWQEIHGNIAALAVCKVIPVASKDPQQNNGQNNGCLEENKDGDHDRDDHGPLSRSCILMGVVADAAGIFPSNTTPPLVLHQSQPPAVLPNQAFAVNLTVNNQWKVSPAVQVVLNEVVNGATPATVSNTWAGIPVGGSVTFSAQEKVPAVLPRQVGESSNAYETRLASLDGTAVTSFGTVSFTDPAGAPFVPARVTSSSQLQIPRLSLALSGPSCATPGGAVPFAIRVTNIGLAGSAAGVVSLTLPDGNAGQVAVPALAPGANYATTFNWNFPSPPQETSGQSTAQYLQALAALDGKPLILAGSLIWQDGLNNVYGPVQSQFTGTVEHLPIVSLTGQIPSTLLPGQNFNVQLAVQNSGSGDAMGATIALRDPSGNLIAVPPFAVAAGQSANAAATVTVPTVAPKSGGETDTVYISRLLGLQAPYSLDAAMTWTDTSGGIFGTTHTSLTSSEAVPVVSASLSGPDTGTVGSALSYVLTLTNLGNASASAVTAVATLPDSTTRLLNLSQSSLAGGTSAVANFTFTPTQAGTIKTKVAITWTDAVPNSYGPVSALATTTVASSHVPTTLTLTASQPGFDVVNSVETLTSVLTDQHGLPIANAAITFDIKGANATTGTSTTDSFGTAKFTLTGVNSGVDKIIASTPAGGSSLQSSSVAVSWVVPARAISTTTVHATFFQENGASFSTSGLQPLGTRDFSVIAFNTSDMFAFNGNAGMNGSTLPDTDFVADVNDQWTGTQVERDQNGNIYGTDFQAVYTGSFVVAKAGSLTLPIWGFGGFFFGIQGASYVSGDQVNIPSTTSQMEYPVLGGNSQPQIFGNAPLNFVVNFPAPGIYPYEFDTFQASGVGFNGFLLSVPGGTPFGYEVLPPANSIALTPNIFTQLNIGQTVSGQVKVLDITGAPVTNTTVTIIVSGPNAQQIETTTDDNGMATFSYQGANPGLERVQASISIFGETVWSNEFQLQWN